MISIRNYLTFVILNSASVNPSKLDDLERHVRHAEKPIIVAESQLPASRETETSPMIPPFHRQLFSTATAVTTVTPPNFHHSRHIEKDPFLRLDQSSYQGPML
jgi:hypothetical protein